MKGTILTLGTLMIVSISSGCATTKGFSYQTALYKMALLKQKQKLRSKCKSTLEIQKERLEFKAGIDWYRVRTAEVEKSLEFSRMVRPIILTMAKVHRSKDAMEAIRKIDKHEREATKILAEMKTELRKLLELQRRHKHLQ